MKNVIEQIDYAHYFDLASLIVPGFTCFYVFDNNGNIVWTNNKNNNPINHIKLHKEAAERNSHKIYTAQYDSKYLLYIKYLYSCSDELYGGLAIVTNNVEQDKKIANIVWNISNFISNELNLSSELESITSELEERYEELNLVYDSDDSAIDTNVAPELLDKLVTNCTDYLDVSMSALILPKEDLTVFNIKKTEKIHYIHSILKQFNNYTFPWVEKNRACIVSNNLSDYSRNNVLPDIPYKIVCSPIYVANNSVGGLFIALNPNSAKDFTNSDRNLIEAMSKKASKITMTHYDALTGLFKRSAYEFFLERALTNCRNEIKSYCLLHLDIDGIKIINTTIDRKAGDYLIVELAKLLKENTRDLDIIARLTGDKFAVLLDSCSLEAGCAIADNLRNSIEQAKFNWQGQIFDVTVCIGVAELNADVENVQSIIAAAELSVGIAKENGRNNVQVFQQDDNLLRRRKDEVQWVWEIQKALKQDRFELYCHPIMPLCSDSDILHFEILIRLLDKDNNIVPPDNFIPAAERYRLMTSIDIWVIENVFKLIHEYKSISHNFMWTINLSGLSLIKIEIAEKILELYKSFDISPKNICFEITETAALSDMGLSLKFINTLKEKGFKFAIDDFGTGSSTFSYLKELPADYLKIDGSFIKNILDDPFADAVVNSIVQVSKVQDIQTIAEYVENNNIINHIKKLGVDFAQGYGVGKPLPFKVCLDNLSMHQKRNDALINKAAI